MGFMNSMIRIDKLKLRNIAKAKLKEFKDSFGTDKAFEGEIDEVSIIKSDDEMWIPGKHDGEWLKVKDGISEHITSDEFKWSFTSPPLTGGYIIPEPIADKIRKEIERDLKDMKKGMSFDEMTKTMEREMNKERVVHKTESPANKKLENISWNYNNNEIKMNSNGHVLGDFVLNRNMMVMGQYILYTLENGLNANIMALGDAGTGKTSFIKRLCKSFDIPFFYLNCAMFRDPSEWFGEKEIVNGDTVFKYSPLSEFIMSDSVGVVILDELNRTSEFTRGVLLSLFDDTKSISIQDNVINVGKGKIFYATANQGYGYTGTFSFDKAEFRRFKYLEFNGITKEQEISILELYGASEPVAKDIVNKMKEIKDKFKQSESLSEVNFEFNIAKSLQVLDFVKGGLSVQDGFLFAVLHGIPVEHRSSIQSIINGNYS